MGKKKATFPPGEGTRLRRKICFFYYITKPKTTYSRKLTTAMATQ